MIREVEEANRFCSGHFSKHKDTGMNVKSSEVICRGLFLQPVDMGVIVKSSLIFCFDCELDMR